MLFDTHAHLNFAAFKENFDTVIKESINAGVGCLIIPGSNVENSTRGVEIAQGYEGVYAAVGIHPFHLFGHIKYHQDTQKDFLQLEKLLQQDKVVAVGEVGLDKHPYKSHKYPDYEISDNLIKLQKQVFIKQIELAIKYKKALIIHHRGLADELLEILDNYIEKLSGKSVFHFCQPEDKLLVYAKKHHVYIGVDGDVTYDLAKQDFVKKIPLELLVLETDSPYILPEPLKSAGSLVNTPQNIQYILEIIGKLKKVPKMELEKTTCDNAKALFLSH